MLTQFKPLTGWQDGVELLVVIWVFVSPVVLGFFDYNAETLSAMIIAAVSTLTILLGLAKQQPWEEWLNLTLALILAASPWIFGYWADEIAATSNAVLSGLVLATFAVLSMVDEYAQMRQQMGGGPKTHGPAG